MRVGPSNGHRRRLKTADAFKRRLVLDLMRLDVLDALHLLYLTNLLIESVLFIDAVNTQPNIVLFDPTEYFSLVFCFIVITDDFVDG